MWKEEGIFLLILKEFFYMYGSERDVVRGQHAKSNSIKLSVMTESPGILTTADITDSDWEAYVDSENAELLEVNLTFRRVEIPSGQHEVIFKYEPKITYVGLIYAFSGMFFKLYC